MPESATVYPVDDDRSVDMEMFFWPERALFIMTDRRAQMRDHRRAALLLSTTP